MNINKLLFLVIYMFSFLFCSNKLIGYVYDKNNNPIKNANIYVDDDRYSSTDEFGEFEINFSDMNSILKVSYIGFDNYEIVLKDFSTNKIVLNKGSLNLDNVVVTATRYYRHIKETPVLVHIITSEDIKNGSFSTVKEMMEVALPNVQMVASNHGSDRVKIQGLDNKYTVFLVDGDRVSGENAANVDFSLFDLTNVKRMEIIEGGMSVLYGSGAIGGVVNIITNKQDKPGWFNVSYFNDNPLFHSTSIQTGFKKSKLYYNINYINKGSYGYDLTPQTPFSKTVEKNWSDSWKHKIIYNFSDYSSLEFDYNLYKSDMKKFNEIFSMESFDYITILDSPLSGYNGKTYKVKFSKEFTNSSNFKVSFFNEKYKKNYYYPYYYSSSNYDIDGDTFSQGLLEHSEFQLQYNYETEMHTRLIGLDYVYDNYSAYSIYDLNGELLHESIFGGNDSSKKRYEYSFFFLNQATLPNDNKLALGVRCLNNDKTIGSISYLIKRKSGYNIRTSFSSGYRHPSLKELYYEWVDHEPHIYGNPNLKPTTNKNISISFDKRTDINDFSIDLYSNNIDNMISTEYVEAGLEYRNYDNVLINGINIHYSREINNKSNFRFVYNFTNPESNSDEILEGISRHAFRMNYTYRNNENLSMSLTFKYTGEKNNFDQEEDWVGDESIKTLDSYCVTDLIFYSNISSPLDLKFGIKNLFDYKDPSRFDISDSNILNSYDPGRRLYFQMTFKLH